MIEKLAPFYKAVSGALIALLTGLVGGLANDGLTTSEVLVSVIAMLTVGGTVFSVPNKPIPPPTPPPPVKPAAKRARA